MKIIMAFLAAVLCPLFLTGCQAQDKPVEKTLKILTMPEASVSKEIMDEFNRKLQEKGADYTIELCPADLKQGFSPSAYIKWLAGKRDSAEGDILLTCYGSAEVPDTYAAAVEQGLFTGLNSYLSSDAGKTLRAAYPDKLWNACKYNGKIYGFPMDADVMPGRIYLNPERMETNGLPAEIADEDIFSFLKNRKAKAGKPSACLDASLLRPKGYMETDEMWLWIFQDAGKWRADFIYDRPDVIALFQNIRSLKQQYRLVDNQTDIKDTGVFFPQFCIDANSDSLAMTSDDHLMPVKSCRFGRSFLPAPQNFVWGVSSRSAHRDEAFDFLNRMCTDAELANLLRYGREGREYRLTGGRVEFLGQNHENEYLPYNTWITAPCRAEPENKNEYLFREIENAVILPPVLYSFDAAVRHRLDTIAEKYEGLWQGKFGNVKNTVRQMKKELTAAGMEKVITGYNKALAACDGWEG